MMTGSFSTNETKSKAPPVARRDRWGTLKTYSLVKPGPPAVVPPCVGITRHTLPNIMTQLRAEPFSNIPDNLPIRM
jgi:hypothetical protein